MPAKDEAAMLDRFPMVFAEAGLERIKELRARCEAAGIEVAIVNNGCRPHGWGTRFLLLGQEHDAAGFRDMIQTEWREMLERDGLAPSAPTASEDDPPCPACGCREPLTEEGECPDCGLCLG